MVGRFDIFVLESFNSCRCLSVTKSQIVYILSIGSFFPRIFKTMICKGGHCGTAVKLPFGTPVLLVRGPWHESEFHFQFQLPANVLPGKQQMMDQVIGFLPPMWKPRMGS